MSRTTAMLVSVVVSGAALAEETGAASATKLESSSPTAEEVYAEQPAAN